MTKIKLKLQCEKLLTTKYSGKGNSKFFIDLIKLKLIKPLNFSTLITFIKCYDANFFFIVLVKLNMNGVSVRSVDEYLVTI